MFMSRAPVIFLFPSLLKPAPSPSGSPLLSGPPTLTDIHQIFIFTRAVYFSAVYFSGTARARRDGAVEAQR